MVVAVGLENLVVLDVRRVYKRRFYVGILASMFRNSVVVGVVDIIIRLLQFLL